MRLLAIDTATEACSVALWLDGVVVERYELAVRGHSVRLPQMVPELLAEAGIAMKQLDGLVCGIGPGSFAGVRIGVGYVKGLALGLDRPVVGVTSLAMLAQAAFSDGFTGIVVPAIDARMNEVYAGAYRPVEGLASAVQADAVVPPERMTASVDGPWRAVGSGWAVHGAILQARLRSAPVSIDGTALPHARDALPRAVAAFRAGQTSDAASLLPAYLRNRVALTQAEQSAARAGAGRTSG